MIRTWTTALLVSAGVALAPALAEAVIQANAGFIQTNPQVFPVGELVDLDAIQSGDDLDLESLPDIFFVDITGTAEDYDTQVVMHVQLEFNGTSLLSFWTQPFLFETWATSPHGDNGSFTNTQLGDFIQDPGVDIDADEARTTYAEVDEFLALLDGSNITSGIMQVRLEVYDEPGALLSSFTDITPVYNPSQPELLSPVDGDLVQGYPVMLDWNWAGGDIGANNWTLIVVEGEPGEDPETVISSRNAATTRYEGPPITESSHHYTGVFSSEQALEDGATYYWMVQADVSTVIPGSSQQYESNVQRFVFQSLGGGGTMTEGDPGGMSAGAPGMPGGPVDPGEHDPVLDLLSAQLPPGMMEMLMAQLDGYTLMEISQDGQPGMTAQQLMGLLNLPSTTVVNVELQD